MATTQDNPAAEHVPVLAGAIIEHIPLPTDAVIIDATEGYGGHSLLLGEKLGAEGKIIGLDVDEKCLETARENLKKLRCRVFLVRENFSEIESVARSYGVKKADLILADLGFCSGQMADAERGLSFQQDMNLDMRLVDKLKEQELADLIYRLGDERASRRIAKFITVQRARQPIKTTGSLSAVICRALNVNPTSRRSKIHPATKTFQALRMAVNSELENLERLLETAPRLLKKGGCFAVISFHSLEDGMVKRNFRQNRDKGIYEILTKKPIVATEAEIACNPRARSAKLRIARCS
ncbi:MAG: 16S rRNA (cytosine(1402)-N(4))-methyltransferase RsmH [Planctomycetota bacterium]|nr:16S rRNA (cytosine(1402)-N(4))-methyltransferase RsmH [Planctomycetota bacterium]